MTSNEEKIHKEPQQLPPIERKQSHQSENEQQASPDDTNNVLPLTHEKKKRKYRKKLRKHSPEHYEQIRIKKLNRKLQQKWDSHFINDQIPDLFEKKKVNRKTLSKLANTVNQKRSSTALNSRMPLNKPVENGLKKQTMPLPKLGKANKRSKSFNIHVVSHKQSQPISNKKKQDQTMLIDTKISESSKKRTRKPSHQQKPQINEQKVNVQDYKKKLNSLFQQKKFLYSHKQTIQLFFQKLNKKSVKQLIDKEFQLLKKNESTINKIMKAIENRQKFIQSLKELIEKPQKEENQMLQIVDNYRTSTLAVVEEILKWKENWQAAYMEHFKKSIVLELVHKTNNYLYTLASSADQIIKKFHQQKEKIEKQQHKKQNQLKDQQKTIPIKSSQVKKTQQKNQETLRQQIETSKRQPQQNIQEKIGSKREKTQKTITQPKEELKQKGQQKQKNQDKKQQNIKSNEQVKLKQQQKPKQIKKEQNSKTKVQIEQEKKQQILLNDPFLISLFAIDKQDKNIILKIRACELLLVQQQFNFLKK